MFTTWSDRLSIGPANASNFLVVMPVAFGTVPSGPWQRLFFAGGHWRPASGRPVEAIRDRRAPYKCLIAAAQLNRPAAGTCDLSNEAGSLIVNVKDMALNKPLGEYPVAFLGCPSEDLKGHAGNPIRTLGQAKQRLV